MDASKMTKAGWKASTDLQKGIEITYEWLLNHLELLK